MTNGTPGPARPAAAVDATDAFVRMTGSGSPERNLVLGRGERPAAGRGNVVVRVEAAGVSYAEVQMLRHLHPFPPAFPFVPGYDLVGRVVEVGPEVTGSQVGDRVAAMPRHGAWRRYVQTSADTLAAVPETLDPAAAVALVTNGVTAWQMLHRRSGARPGDTVVVHGASGGVGTLLTQLAVQHGLRVLGTASPGKHALVRALGARPLDYRAPGLPRAVRELAPGGVRAVFDHVGGRGLDESWAMLAPGGTLISYDSSVAGYRAGQWFRPHVPALRRTGQRWVARHLGRTRGRRMSMYYVRPGEHFAADLAALYRLADAGVLRPEIAGRHPLDAAARAVRALLEGSTAGKHVLLP